MNTLQYNCTPCSVHSVVKYITGESTLGENVDTTVTPEKALVDKEKELLDKLRVSGTASSVGFFAQAGTALCYLNHAEHGS